MSNLRTSCSFLCTFIIQLLVKDRLALKINVVLWNLHAFPGIWTTVWEMLTFIADV